MLDQIRRYHPDAVFYLGDGLKDLDYLYQEWPGLEVHSVPGNCDGWTGRPLEQIVELKGFRFLLTHGHGYQVKAGLGGLLAAAKEQGADAAFFGHTHRPCCEQADGLWLINPGSVGSYCSPDFGVLRLENGAWTYQAGGEKEKAQEGKSC